MSNLNAMILDGKLSQARYKLDVARNRLFGLLHHANQTEHFAVEGEDLTALRSNLHAAIFAINEMLNVATPDKWQAKETY